MKFKLIHNQTKEEHICTKVVIDNFDYYMSDSIAKNGDKLYLLRDSLLGKEGDIITVVSTRDSHTDIIKANGDSHWFASNTEFQREWNWKKVIASNSPNSEGIGKIVCEFYNEQDFINFIEWSAVNANPKFPNKNEWYLKSFNPPKEVSTSELLKFWKENHKLNMLYYE